MATMQVQYIMHNDTNPNNIFLYFQINVDNAVNIGAYNLDLAT